MGRKERETTYHATFFFSPLMSANILQLAERTKSLKLAHKTVGDRLPCLDYVGGGGPCVLEYRQDHTPIRVLSPLPSSATHVERCNAGRHRALVVQTDFRRRWDVCAIKGPRGW
jgi:hypothetical protein